MTLRTIEEIEDKSSHIFLSNRALCVLFTLWFSLPKSKWRWSFRSSNSVINYVYSARVFSKRFIYYMYARTIHITCTLYITVKMLFILTRESTSNLGFKWLDAQTCCYPYFYSSKFKYFSRTSILTSWLGCSTIRCKSFVAFQIIRPIHILIDLHLHRHLSLSHTHTHTHSL